jgi:exopolysaccharide biosynthesis polyprenyl glycosylphosphotransferase
VEGLPDRRDVGAVALEAEARRRPRLFPNPGSAELFARAVATLVPVLIMAATWDGRSVLLFCVTAPVWLVSINVGLAATSVSLASLGPSIAVLRGALLGLIATSVLGAWAPALHVGVLQNLLAALGVFVLVAAWEKWGGSRLRARVRVIVVGSRSACAAVEHELHARRDRRFVVLGAVDDAPPKDETVLGGIAELPEVIEQVRPDLVAIAPGADRPATFAQLLELSDRGFRVLELAHFYEYAFGTVPVRDLTGAWFMSVLHIYQRPYSRAAKRSCDIVGSLAMLVFFAPLFALTALLVRFTSGPIIVRQIRVGEHGRLFTMYKFRSMRADAERPGEAVWAAKRDPRVTVAGHVMRRLRLDEFPQIVNVLKGDMSLVGPRPERPEFVDVLSSVPFWTRRHLVKPGITGWAQVRHGYTSDTDGSLAKLSYDLWYVRHRSLTVDLAIIAQTVIAVLWGDRRFSDAPVGAMPGQQVAKPHAAFRSRVVRGER